MLSVELLILTAVAAWQVVSITRAKYPAIRAVEALSVTTPLFLLLFAAGYFLLAQDNPANFSPHTLTRTDTLYFTVTTFSTVGFGDIVATSPAARLIVTVQMLLDLLVLVLAFGSSSGQYRPARGGNPRQPPIYPREADAPPLTTTEGRGAIHAALAEPTTSALTGTTDAAKQRCKAAGALCPKYVYRLRRRARRPRRCRRRR